MPRFARLQMDWIAILAILGLVPGLALGTYLLAGLAGILN